MVDSVFKYPGGKTRVTGQLLDILPSHETYVEAFGGAATLLVNKPRSTVEVYNDLDDDLAVFFVTLRDRAEELEEWLETTPFHRTLWDDIAHRWFTAGQRPDDDVVRAGEFFFLRYSQFSGATSRRRGFGGSRTRNTAAAYDSARSQLTEFAERFRGVQIESLDYRDLLDRYDGPGSLTYLDPPYPGTTRQYRCDDLDMGEFVETVNDLDGEWIVSLNEVPDGLQHVWSASESDSYAIGSGSHGDAKDMTEHILTSFDPDTTPLFRETGQVSLGEVDCSD